MTGVSDKSPIIGSSDHRPHYGDHDNYACGFSGPHCWECGEPWPCRESRGIATDDQTWPDGFNAAQFDADLAEPDSDSLETE